MVCACQKGIAQVQTASLEEIYLHCPESTVVVYKEINDSFGMRLRVKDCDLSLIKPDKEELEELAELINESPARQRRIKRRQTRIARLNSQE